MMEPAEMVRRPSGEAPVLVVVIDTEEEFDWSGGFRRDATSVEAMRGVDRFQAICDEFGIVPHYAIDYPVASQPAGFEALRRFAAEGRAEIGAHLHPWVNPPFTEEVNALHSYPGNLDAGLEREKLRALADEIERNFGFRPRAYKAGRYGLGPNTARILEEEGFELDLSVCPRVDLGEDGGPDFRDFGPWPFWFGEKRRLLELPVTCAWTGFLRAAGRVLDGRGRAFRLPALLSRARAFERLRLSPEGMTSGQHQRLARDLCRRGVPVLTFSFHSPSLRPGYTQYVKDEAELDAFLETCRSFFGFFRDRLGGRFHSPVAIRAEWAAGGGS